MESANVPFVPCQHDLVSAETESVWDDGFVFSKLSIDIPKLRRANGECLGAEHRRRTRLAAISHGKPPSRP